MPPTLFPTPNDLFTTAAAKMAAIREVGGITEVKKVALTAAGLPNG
jgi:hypothetical protein